MRKFTILLVMALISSFVFGQSMMEKKTRSIPVKGGDMRNDSKATVIWSNDFSNATEWTMEYDTENPNDGPWVIGTTGPAGYYSAGMGAIESTTAANGFAMYDSDGIGVSTTSQDSKMVYNGTIDCSAYTKVAVSFESYYRKFHGTPYLEISVNGTDWTQFEVHTDIDINSASGNPTLVMVNISAVAAGQSTVYLRFRYIGEWDYAWMVDDISMFEAPDYDVALQQARVNFWPEYINYGYSGFYGLVPQEQINGVGAPVFFSGIIKNYGSQTVTPILTATVQDGDANELYTIDATFEAPIAVEEFDTVSTSTEDVYFFDPAEVGEYHFLLSASIDGQTDENTANNNLEYVTWLTNNEYAHDQGNVTGSWSTCNYTDGCNDGDIIGVTFPFFVSTQFNSIDFYVSSMTEVGTGYVAKIMIWDEGSSGWAEVSSSTYYSIDSEEEVGVMHSVPMIDNYYIEVPEGDFVELLAAVEFYTNSGANEWRFGIDGTVPTSGWETWMYFMGDQWYYYGGTHVPIIRMNVGEPSAVNNISANADVTIYPNPTDGTISIGNVENATIEVINLMGQVIKTVNSSFEVNNIDLSNFANGTYFVRVVKGNNVSTSKINLVK
ncbi:MAG TPA: T9SS type A sorting domain-containing protein [Bacteroidales bacterium]|nr:T9SS type A sorting domain-containing protein [Bacteroidales bacterium]